LLVTSRTNTLPAKQFFNSLIATASKQKIQSVNLKSSVFYVL
jgi:hypothetical protein